MKKDAEYEEFDTKIELHQLNKCLKRIKGNDI